MIIEKNIEIARSLSSYADKLREVRAKHRQAVFILNNAIRDYLWVYIPGEDEVSKKERLKILTRLQEEGLLGTNNRYGVCEQARRYYDLSLNALSEALDLIEKETQNDL